jgi:hypothetical protein
MPPALPPVAVPPAPALPACPPVAVPPAPRPPVPVPPAPAAPPVLTDASVPAPAPPSVPASGGDGILHPPFTHVVFGAQSASLPHVVMQAGVVGSQANG